MHSNTGRNSLYEKWIKKKRELNREISCSICPYNRVENIKGKRQKPDRYKTRRKGFKA
jgi:hypothetical protein